MSQQYSTRDHILMLEDEYADLVRRSAEWTADDYARFVEVRPEIAALWEAVRDEDLLAKDGPPLFICDMKQMPHGRPRLPIGGEL